MTVTDLDTRTLRLMRIFDAPRERVFDAWAVQEQFVQWMCPPGVTIDECVIDVRPGGAWRIRGHHSGDQVFASSGTYLEVERPVRLVFTWAHHADGDYAKPRGHETTVRIELRALGAKTELTLLHGPFADDPSTERHREGWTGSFDKLEGFLRRTA
ncbi:MAG: SRPBCC domain-containing protein [Proteobacteria bacterium]|nr:SRPBCC domain-containing protein [Pseudomonadota bacterium]